MSAGVIGWPVSHSKSPLIHRFWLAKLGLDGDYGRFPVHPDRLGEAIRALPALGLRGVNVTVPHKVAAMAYLDRLDPVAERVGAVNTVVIEADGERVGYNTDVAGVQAALGELPGNAEPCIIGAGGAARAALAAIDRNQVGIVLLVARDLDRARSILSEFGFGGGVYGFDDPGHAIGTAHGAIINATPLGMRGQPPMPQAVIDAIANPIDDNIIVFDMVYDPLETELLRAARTRGLPTVDGLVMLVGQAAAAFELFYGQPAPREHDAELRALLTA